MACTSISPLDILRPWLPVFGRPMSDRQALLASKCLCHGVYVCMYNTMDREGPWSLTLKGSFTEVVQEKMSYKNHFPILSWGLGSPHRRVYYGQMTMEETRSLLPFTCSVYSKSHMTFTTSWLDTLSLNAGSVWSCHAGQLGLPWKLYNCNEGSSFPYSSSMEKALVAFWQQLHLTS